MEVRKIDNNRITFQKIQLAKAEQERAMKLLTNLTTLQTHKSIENLKLEIFEIFDSHLQKEVSMYNKLYVYKKDFSQTFYLKFFEILDQICKKIILPDNFIELLNQVRPAKDDYIEHSISLDVSISENDKKTFIENITAEDLPVYASQRSEEERKEFDKEVQKISRNTELNKKEKAIFDFKKVVRL